MSAQVRDIDSRDWSHKTRFCTRETVKLRDDTEITLRELTVPEFREWRKLAESLDDDAGQDSFLCRCICDETGRPLTGADEIVSALPVSEYARVSDIAAELNGIGQKKASEKNGVSSSG